MLAPTVRMPMRGVKRALAVPRLEVHAYAEEEYRRFGETNVSLGTLSPSSMTLG